MFYPKNKIKTGLYTSGGEYKVISTNKMYIGYYFTTFDDKIFTGKEPSINSEELIKTTSSAKKASHIQNSLYDMSKKSSKTPEVSYVPYLPNPQNEDYIRGYIDRYFIKRINGDADTIVELSENDYNSLINNSLYQNIKIRWKISGPKEDILSNPELPIYGIESTNRRTLERASTQMPTLPRYLKNLMQFARLST